MSTGHPLLDLIADLYLQAQAGQARVAELEQRIAELEAKLAPKPKPE